MSEITHSNEDFYSKISEILKSARNKVVQSINTTIVETYFEIGRLIVEEEQNGNERAEYGKKILKELSNRLKNEFGKGFSVENLDRMRYFYKVYSKQNSSTVLTNFEQASLKNSTKAFNLSWSHYIFLMRVDNVDERNFYEIEAMKN